MTQALSEPFPRRYTVEEYLKIDTDSEIRHEYIDGQIIDMAGGNDPHSVIAVNLLSELRSRLRDKPCKARDGNIRVRYGKKVRYGYPDALIVCGQPQFDPTGAGNVTLLNPKVLFEVLSGSTEAYDRGKKFTRYCDIRSFEEYVLIAQDAMSVEVRRRHEGASWTLEGHHGRDAIAKIGSVGIELPLAEIYLGIDFPPDADDESSAESP